MTTTVETGQHLALGGVLPTIAAPDLVPIAARPVQPLVRRDPLSAWEAGFDPLLPAGADVPPGDDPVILGLDGTPVSEVSREDALAMALSVIVQAEAAKAALDASVLPAWRALHAAYESPWTERVAPAEVGRAGETARLARAAVTGCVQEVMAATGLSERECRSRLRLAEAGPQRAGILIAMLGEGQASLTAVIDVFDACVDLPDEVAHRIGAAVLADEPDGNPPSTSRRRRRLKRLLTAAYAALDAEARAAAAAADADADADANASEGGEAGSDRDETDGADAPAAVECGGVDASTGELLPDGAGGARAAALARRGVLATLYPVGDGELSVTGDAARISAALARVDRIARDLKAHGHHQGRTLAQLRSDVTLDLILFGAVGTETGCPSAAIDWSRLGELPPAHVQVVVPLDALLDPTGSGATSVGELRAPLAAAAGYLTGEHARAVALAAGSVWTRLVTDPLTGHLVELSTHRYRPTPRLAAHVTARHTSCTGPGCTVPASGSDLDHGERWPQGRTCSANLDPKHRAHHELKTLGHWQAEHDPTTHAIRWTTAAGRHYVVPPTDYRELGCPELHDPVPMLLTDNTPWPDLDGDPQPSPGLGPPVEISPQVDEPDDETHYPLTVIRHRPRARSLGRRETEQTCLPTRSPAPAGWGPAPSYPAPPF
ncbi:MAG TPA: hypothetical protein P5181_12980 [Dermatophilaceae bacterium]|nr:hypothetical protein [Dermatophilaceae bacterium]